MQPEKTDFITPSSPPKILFLDMEGTVLMKEHRLDDGRVAPSAWTVLAQELGEACLAEENATKDLWITGGYRSYLDWMRATVAIHKRHGLTKEIFDRVISNVQLTPGVFESINHVHRWGTRTVLITGGFKELAVRVQIKLKVDHAFAACEYFFREEDGLIDHFNLLPADELGKVDFMNLMCREYGVSLQQCAFIGDGKNDVELAKLVGYSVAFNAQQELECVASHVVRQGLGNEDFREAVTAVSLQSFI